MTDLRADLTRERDRLARELAIPLDAAERIDALDEDAAGASSEREDVLRERERKRARIRDLDEALFRIARGVDRSVLPRMSGAQRTHRRAGAANGGLKMARTLKSLSHYRFSRDELAAIRRAEEKARAVPRPTPEVPIAEQTEIPADAYIYVRGAPRDQAARPRRGRARR